MTLSIEQELEDFIPIIIEIIEHKKINSHFNINDKIITIRVLKELLGEKIK